MATETRKKNTYIVFWQYRYGDERTSKVKAYTSVEAAHIVEARKLGNYVTGVELYDPCKHYDY